MVPGFSSVPRLRAASDEMLHLDLLRFVACVGVVIHHSVEFLLPVSIRASLPTGLALFVDLFFVISGFVIARVYEGKVGTVAGYGSFLQRRVARLLPLHLLTLAVMIAVWSAFSALGKAANHEPSHEVRCILETAVFLHALMPCGNGIVFHSATWSIGAEMVMYLMFPIFAWIAVRTKAGFVIATFATFLAAMAVDLTENAGSRSWIDLWPPFRALPSFMFGIVLLCYRDKVSKIPRPDGLLLLSSVLMVLWMVTDASHVIGICIVYLVATLAVAADVQRTISTPVKRLSPLGQLTYSIYMWHSVVILVILNAFGDKLLHASTAVMAMLTIVSYAIIFGVSYFSFFAIETPARRFIDSLGAPPRRAVPVTS
jgi:peptidoglycan/LPS O-acetylase OafA/YrhL